MFVEEKVHSFQMNIPAAPMFFGGFLTLSIFAVEWVLLAVGCNAHLCEFVPADFALKGQFSNSAVLRWERGLLLGYAHIFAINKYWIIIQLNKYRYKKYQIQNKIKKFHIRHILVSLPIIFNLIILSLQKWDKSLVLKRNYKYKTI